MGGGRKGCELRRPPPSFCPSSSNPSLQRSSSITDQAGSPASLEFPGGAYIEFNGKVASPGRAKASRLKVVNVFLASFNAGSILEAVIFDRQSERKRVR